MADDKRALTDDELRALTDAEIQDATGYCGGTVAAARQRAESYFLGLAKGDLAPPEIDGRSSVVDTTVRNTVLGMEAPLIKTFCGTDHVVEFVETQPDDAPKAKQATEYLNYLLRKKNPGYQIISTWIRDALLQKVGFVKVWWDASPVTSREEYRGQTDVQLAILLDDDEIEVIGQKSYPDPDAEKQHAKIAQQMQAQLAQMAQAAQHDQNAAAQFQQADAQYQQFASQPVPQLYDITVQRTKSGGKLCIENIPPEEMLVARTCRRMDDHTFKGHKIRRTIGELRASGYLNVDDITSDDSADSSPEAVSRRWMDDDFGVAQTYSPVDPDARVVWVTECYVHADVQGTGQAAWHKIVRAGNLLLEHRDDGKAKEVDEHPFVDLPCILLPHRFFGLSEADLAMEDQRLLTALKRNVLDNAYLQTNGRYFAVDGQVNLDDLLNSRPGGVVRIKNQGAVGALDQGRGDLAAGMQLIEAFKVDAEESTGWTRQSQGGNGLQLSQTATQANIVTNRADSRVEIISRTMAETGFTTLFKKMLRLVTQYQDKKDTVKLSGEWADVDPREWTNQFDLSINVGLGTGNKDQQVQHLLALKQQMIQALQIGYATPENLYNADVKLTEALGFKNGDAFFTDPKKMPPKQPPQDPAIVKAQLDDQAHQRDTQLKAQQQQMDAQQAQFKAQIEAEAQMRIDQNRQQAEAEKHQLKMQYEAQFNMLREQNRMAERAADIEFQKYKLDREIDGRIVVAQIAAKQALDAGLQAAEADANADITQDGAD